MKSQGKMPVCLGQVRYIKVEDEYHDGLEPPPDEDAHFIYAGVGYSLQTKRMVEAGHLPQCSHGLSVTLLNGVKVEEDKQSGHFSPVQRRAEHREGQDLQDRNSRIPGPPDLPGKGETRRKASGSNDPRSASQPIGWDTLRSEAALRVEKMKAYWAIMAEIYPGKFQEHAVRNASQMWKMPGIMSKFATRYYRHMTRGGEDDD